MGITRAFFDFLISRQHMQLFLLEISASDDRCCIKYDQSFQIYFDTGHPVLAATPPRCQSVGIHRHKCLILLWRLHPINNRHRAVGSPQCQAASGGEMEEGVGSDCFFCIVKLVIACPHLHKQWRGCDAYFNYRMGQSHRLLGTRPATICLQPFSIFQVICTVIIKPVSLTGKAEECCSNGAYKQWFPTSALLGDDIKNP